MIILIYIYIEYQNLKFRLIKIYNEYKIKNTSFKNENL